MRDENGKKNSSQVQFSENLGIDLVTIATAKSALKMNVLLKEPTIFFGPAGVGKTELVKQVRDELEAETGEKWGLWITHLHNYEKEEIAGYTFPPPNPVPGRVNKGIHVMNDFLPLEEEVPKYGMLFVDEINRAEISVIKTMLTLMEERKFGAYTLPRHWVVVMAANYSGFNYSVTAMEKDPAIRRRMCVMGVKVDLFEWLKYAEGRFHPLVVEFIKQHNDALYDWGAHDSGQVGTNPAAWEKVSKTLKLFEQKFELTTESQFVLTQKLSGNIGKKVASEFMTFYATRYSKVDAAKILKEFRCDPQNICYQQMLMLAKQNAPEEGSDAHVFDTLGEVVFRVLNIVNSERPNETETAATLGHMSKFLAEHSVDLVGALQYQLAEFAQEDFERQSTSTYTRLLNTAIFKSPEYKEAVERIRERRDLASEEMGKAAERAKELVAKFKAQMAASDEDEEKEENDEEKDEEQCGGGCSSCSCDEDEDEDEDEKGEDCDADSCDECDSYDADSGNCLKSSTSQESQEVQPMAAKESTW